MVWAIDQREQSQDNGLGSAYGVTKEQQSDANQLASDSVASDVACYTADCGDTCKAGTFLVTQMSGQPGQVSTKTRCDKGKYHSLCCSDGTSLGTCQWRGWRGAGLSCMGGCADGETTLARNTNHHSDKEDQTCNGGLQSYCCTDYQSGPGLKEAIEDAAEDAAEALAEQAALDLAAKAFCRVAVPALLAPLELLEDLIPIVGEILDIAEIAATPALIQACVKGVEKEGKAEFKVFGKKESLSWSKPTQKPTTRKPESTHTSASTKSDASSCSVAKRLMPRVDPASLRTDTITSQYDATETNPPIRRTCDGLLYPQACFHYSSVIDKEVRVSSLLQCTDKALRAVRNVPNIWSNPLNGQHDGAWITGWMQAPNINCQRDEFPPAIIWQGRDDAAVWIRFLPGTQNAGAGQLFNGVCADDPPTRITNRRMVDSGNGAGCRPWESWTSTVITAYNVLDLQFNNMVPDPYGLSSLIQNPCWPSTLYNDPGFALMTEDYFYDAQPANLRAFAHASFPNPPQPAITQGKVNQPGWNRVKRGGLEFESSGAPGAGWADPDEIVVVGVNSTRKATPDELYSYFGLVRCTEEGCVREQQALGVESAMLHVQPKSTVPVTPATATPVVEAAMTGMPPETRVVSFADGPKETGASDGT